MAVQLLLNKNTSEIMDVSRETPDVTTKPHWHDLTDRQVRPVHILYVFGLGGVFAVRMECPQACLGD